MSLHRSHARDVLTRGIATSALLFVVACLFMIELVQCKSSSKCDSTLSFIEKNYYSKDNPNLGGYGFIYQQLSCSLYNRTQFFIQSNSGKIIYSTSQLLNIQLPRDEQSFDGIAWNEMINMELKYDPLEFMKERWMWTPDGSVLINDWVSDHISKKQDTLNYIWRAQTMMFSSDLNSSDKVLKRSSLFSRGYTSPADPNNLPFINHENQTILIEKIK